MAFMLLTTYILNQIIDINLQEAPLINTPSTKPVLSRALALALLAIAADYALLWLQRRLTPKGAAARPSLVSRR